MNDLRVAGESTTEQETERKENVSVSVSVNRGRRMSFREACEFSEKQVDAETVRRFFRNERGAGLMLRDCCRVMAEIYMMPGQNLIRIEREDLPAEMVAEIFREIQTDHVIAAIAIIGQMYDQVRYKRAYIRTVLYNTVFEETKLGGGEDDGQCDF